MCIRIDGLSLYTPRFLKKYLRLRPLFFMKFLFFHQMRALQKL